MAEDYECEDIVFEGHELCNYLNNCGYTDFEMVKQSSSSQNEARHTKCLHSSESIWMNLKSKYKVYSSRYSDKNSLEINFYQDIVKVILHKRLLLEEDCHFVANVISHQLNGQDRIVQNLSLNCKLLLYIAVPCCWTWWHYSGAQLRVPVVLSALAITPAIWQWSKSYQRTQRLKLITNTLNKMSEVFMLLRKVLRSVEENELIARGFTLAQTGSKISILENSSLPFFKKKWNTILGFREILLDATLKAIVIFSSATRSLILQFPLVSQVDKMHHYVSMLDEELLQFSNPTDSTLTSLKKPYHVYLLLQSEFLRRLALCFCPELWTPYAEEHMFIVWKVINEVMISCSQLITELSAQYKMYYSFGGYGENVNKLNSSNIIRHDCKYYGVYMAVHSAILHLQNILSSCITTEQIIESQAYCNDDNPNFDANDLLNNLEINISEMMEELNSCQSCYTEGITQLKKLKLSIGSKGDATENTIKVGVEEAAEETKVAKEKPIQVGYSDFNPQVEDEIFEAVVNYEQAKDDTDFLRFTKEECMKLEVEREFHKKMLQELKVVLVDKAQEWMEREAKAMEKKNSKLGTNNLKVESISDVHVKPLFASDLGKTNNLKILGGKEQTCESSTNSNVSGNKSRDCMSVSDSKHSTDDLQLQCPNQEHLNDFHVETSGSWPLPRLKNYLPKRRKTKSSSTQPQQVPVNIPVGLASLEIHQAVQTIARSWAADVQEEVFCVSGENSSLESDDE